MADIYFSMIVYVDNDELLKKSIDSIVGPQVKIIVVDAICSETSINLCAGYKEKYGERFKYFKTFGMTVGEAYNVAIPEIEGRYVNFSLASIWFSQGSINTLQYIAEGEGRPKLVSLTPWTVNEKHEYVQYRMSPVFASDSFHETIHLNDTPSNLQLMFHAYFIRCYLINSKERHMFFKPELLDDACMEMLFRLLAEIRGYLYLPKQKVNYTHQLEDNTSVFSNQYQEWWYIDSLKNWILPFAEEWNRKDYPIRKPMRLALFYLVYARLNCNYNDRNKGILHGEKLKEFLNLVGRVLQYIDNKMIFDKNSFNNFVVPRGMRVWLLRLKAEMVGKKCEAVVYGQRLYMWTHIDKKSVSARTLSMLPTQSSLKIEDLENVQKELDYTAELFTITRDTEQEHQIPIVKRAYEDDVLIPVCDISKEHVIIRTINYQNATLKIDGLLSIGDFLPHEQIKLKIVKDGENIPVAFSEVYGLEKLFGETYYHRYMFHIDVPVLMISKKSMMQFVIEINGQDIVLEIRTQTVYSHVREDIKGQYWHFADEWCLSIARKNEMYLTWVTEEELKQKEESYQEELSSRARKGDAFAAYALELRQEYFKRKKDQPNERIWITFDKLYKAGDNGEYMYDYISSQDDGIDIRYLIKSDSPDYERMQEKGDKLLVWGEKETLVTALCAEVILTTHANIVSYLGFEKEILSYICDLFQPVNVCIQHGLTVQNIAQFQNRLFDNLQLYLCASQNEIENLRRPIYGFDDETALKLVGIARYDGLQSNDQKQILITPTWRRDIVNSNVAHVKKEHNDSFKNSEYYRIYNRLINDEKLIKTAKRYKYKIVYLLHPATSAQLEDYEKNDYVELIPGASDTDYEKILTESSLMITDYSGVQFDFAYMRKPLLYYHPKTLPPHYNESAAYVYEKDAFGPIIDSHEKLVDEICDYMKDRCRMKTEYKERADRFFAYNDFENRKRIYRTILEFLNS